MGEEKTEERIFTAKNISKIFKFIASIGVIVCAFLKWAGILPNATIGEICVAWSVVYGLGAGTIDANLMIDKFRGEQ